jgi:F-type H+-transporting ATPase subunit b
MHEIEVTPLISFNLTFVMILITLLALFIVLKIFFFDKVKNFMDERTAEVQKTYDEADEAKAAGEEAREKYSAELAKANAERTEIIKEARATAEKRADTIVAKAKAEAAEIVNRAEEKAKAETAKSLETAKDQIALLAVLGAEQILKTGLTEEQKKAYLDRIDLQQISKKAVDE